MNLLLSNVLLRHVYAIVLHVMLQHIRYHWVVFKYPIKLAYEVVILINPASCLMAYSSTCWYCNSSVIAEAYRIVSTCSHGFTPPLLLLALFRFG